MSVKSYCTHFHPSFLPQYMCISFLLTLICHCLNHFHFKRMSMFLQASPLEIFRIGLVTPTQQNSLQLPKTHSTYKKLCVCEEFYLCSIQLNVLRRTYKSQYCFTVFHLCLPLFFCRSSSPLFLPCTLACDPWLFLPSSLSLSPSLVSSCSSNVLVWVTTPPSSSYLPPLTSLPASF